MCPLQLHLCDVLARDEESVAFCGCAVGDCVLFSRVDPRSAHQQACWTISSQWAPLTVAAQMLEGSGVYFAAKIDNGVSIVEVGSICSGCGSMQTAEATNDTVFARRSVGVGVGVGAGKNDVYS